MFKNMTLEEMMMLLENNKRTLNNGTEEYNQFLEKLIMDIQDVKSGLKRGESRHKHRKEVSKLQGAIEALKYLERKSSKKMLLNQNQINEDFNSRSIRKFLRGLPDED